MFSVPSVPKAVPIPYGVASFDRPATRHDAVGSSHRYHRWPIDRLVVEDDHETTISRNKEAEALLYVTVRRGRADTFAYVHATFTDGKSNYHPAAARYSR